MAQSWMVDPRIQRFSPTRKKWAVPQIGPRMPMPLMAAPKPRNSLDANTPRRSDALMAARIVGTVDPAARCSTANSLVAVPTHQPDAV
eukprot:scaffold18398_cov63-Phaeocystis_antarctica.AAC.2